MVNASSRADAAALKRGLEDPTVRAFTIVMGVLLELPEDRARRRVLQFVAEHFEAAEGNGTPPAALRLHLEQAGSSGE